MQENVIKQITELRKASPYVTLVADEWRSIARKRFLNISLMVGNELFNLGLIRLYKGDAQSLLDATIKKLAEFQLTLDDISSYATDGASVMKKFAKLSKKDIQLCYLHGLHLGVVKIFYSKKKTDYSND